MKNKSVSFCKTIVVTIALLFIQSVGMAAQATCEGKIVRLSNLTYGVESGTFGLHLNNTSYIRLCSFDAQFFNMSPDSCKHLSSLAAMAYAAGDTVSITIDNAPTSECSSIGVWFKADVRHFFIIKS